MLALLHELKGVDFIKQLRLITERREFRPLETDPQIYSVGGERSNDYESLINAARKGIRTADYIFVRKGVLRLFDLKTITGKNSVGNRLLESLGQTDRVLLNLQTNYNVRHLTHEIKRYFEYSIEIQEVLIFFGTKEISIKRNIVSSRGFLKMMMNNFR